MSIRARRKMEAERNALCTELPLIENRLRRAGLFTTATAMNKAVQAIGFEVERARERDRYNYPVPAHERKGG